VSNELVFKALSDASRRTLLDLLFQQNGMTLQELQQHLPMTRFGCMKHLRVLEDAGLVVARKSGREKRHYLNPVPIQEVYERWVSKYASPWAAGLTSLKSALENDQMTTHKPTAHQHVLAIYIRTTPEKLWQALTDGDTLQSHHFLGARVDSTWVKGAPYTYTWPNGGVMLSGDVLDITPLKRLVTTFTPKWEAGKESPTSKVTYEIEPQGSMCKLTIMHDDLDTGTDLGKGIMGGWARFASSLKSLLETGQALKFAA
jgi:uncharacterized protein YndB with AHSA1/START domain/DNA-binding transcriptional ArsR family regulator